MGALNNKLLNYKEKCLRMSCKKQKAPVREVYKKKISAIQSP